MSDKRVLVVGTTPDYIAHIEKAFRGRALFLTDIQFRNDPGYLVPDKSNEIVMGLDDVKFVKNAVANHLEEWGQTLIGITCFDCENLVLAAKLAEWSNLPYPSVKSVCLSRDKYLTKKKWLENGVKCPRIGQIDSLREGYKAIKELGGPGVLKPLNGSGSELTFLCRDNFDLTIAYREVRNGLEKRKESPLYRTYSENMDEPEIPLMLLEEFIEGREYSADFIINADRVDIIRIAKKIKSESLPFGTTLAYFLPARLPGKLTLDILSLRLKGAANALGFDRAICMVDFIIHKDEIIFLEMTPRIGGDCLPQLIDHSCGLDIIVLALEFAEGKEISIPPHDKWKDLTALRIFASESGKLVNIDCSALSRLKSIKEIYFKFASGHEILLPPDEYDSWCLGHLIFEPETGKQITQQCLNIVEKIAINLEQHHDQWITRFFNTSR
ncbi:MAG: ATP-grasp domain-containing protein [Candidatus Zixiibacteriota bacterium]